MKTIKINAYDYQDLDNDSKRNVKIWLDELPFDYEDEDEKGNIIKKLDYPDKLKELDKDIQMYVRIINSHKKQIEEALDKDELDKILKSLIGMLKR